MTTNNSGQVEGTYTSLPFGDALAVSGADNDPRHFAMLDYDYNSGSNGTYHAQFRQYDLTQGQWMSPDMYSGSYDFSNPQSFNRYSYVGNNPLSAVDPSGQNPCTVAIEGGAEAGGTVGAVIGGVACVAGILGVGRLLETLLGLGARPTFHGTLNPRPKAQPWDEYHIHYGANIAGALGIPDAGCDFGACGGGPEAFSGGGGDPTTQIQSLYENILEHLKWIAENPESQAVPHWRSEVATWAKEILQKAGKRQGSIDKYLLRIIEVRGSDLENFLYSPFIIVNPCVIDPSQPYCHRSYNGPA